MEPLCLDILVDLGVPSYRRNADKCWDFAHDKDAPAVKRVRVEEETRAENNRMNGDKRTVNHENKAGTTFNECGMDIEGKNSSGDVEYYQCEKSLKCSTTSSPLIETANENMIFPPMVALYDCHQPISHFSYCDRSVFSRHLFF
ncbi:hypothetical protein Q1695_001737 [Nippostrongylus brasiliensis]|nr:hypothetical protein Q1695_001737 [Nippostrongylus brasiliensis]